MLAVASMLSAGTLGISLGDRLDQTFTNIHQRPIYSDEAIADGWSKAGWKNALMDYECVPGLGIRYEKPDEALSLYYTALGQLSGIRVEFNDVNPELGKSGFFAPSPTAGQFFLNIGFRSDALDAVCVRDRIFNEPVGTGITVFSAPGLPELPMQLRQIPMTTANASKAPGWRLGACINHLGTHWLYDLKAPGEFPGLAADMHPIIPMYNPYSGALHALLFTIGNDQGDATGRRGWEPKPLPNAFMCANFCDAACDWPDAREWSTMHLFFNDDYGPLVCPADLVCHVKPGVGCCPPPSFFEVHGSHMVYAMIAGGSALLLILMYPPCMRSKTGGLLL